MKVRYPALAAVAAMAIGATVQAAIPFTGSYSENFDSMGAAGTVAPTDWTLASLGTSIPANGGSGLAMTAKTPLIVDNGSWNGSPNGTQTGTGGAFNYGSTGSAERALGAIPTTAFGGAIVYQAAFTNNTGGSITSLDIAYVGEQWRYNQGTSSTGTEKFVLYYSTDAINAFTPVGLDFVAPWQTTGSPYSSLDGNAPANRLAVSGSYTLPSPLADGGSFYLRWFDQNDGGTTDHGLAIDDVTIAVPEPTSMAVLGLGALALIRRRRA